MLATLRPLFPYLRRYSRDFMWGGLSVVISNAIWILFPQVIRIAIDDLNHGVTRQKIFLYAGLLVLISAAKGVFLFLTRWIIIGISREIEFDLRNDLFRHLERQPAAYFQQHRTGDIMARMTNDLNAVRMLLGPAIMYSANTVLFSIGALYFLLRISPWLTLVALVPLPLASILVQSLGRKIHERFERIQAMYSEISAQAQENFSGARLVRAFAQEEAQIAAFEKSNKENIRRGLRLVQLMGMLWPTLEFVLGLAMAITLLVGGHEVLSHRISIGDFVAFNTYMVMLTWPVIALGWVVNLWQRGTASVVRIDELLSDKPTIDNAEADSSIPAESDAARRYRISRPEFLLFRLGRRPCGGAALAVAQGSGRDQSRHRGTHRLRQIEPGQPDSAALRRRAGKRSDRRASHPRLSAGRAARQYRLRAPGNFSIQPDHSRKHRLWRSPGQR